MQNEAELNQNSDVVNRKLKGISKEEISGQGLIFFLAAYETTNNTLCHVIYYLIKHPEWQEKLYQELSRIEEINYDTLRDLKILNSVINETLRLKPPLLLYDRKNSEDYYLEDYGK